MYQIFNLTSSPNVKVQDRKGPFTVITHLQQLARKTDDPMQMYYSALLQHRQRQLICSLKEEEVLIGEGMMQWMVGDIAMSTNVTGPIRYLDKKLWSRMTGQNVIVADCTGTGEVILEPVDSDIMLVDLKDWDEGLILENDMFLACTGGVDLTIASRSNFSSIAFGREGLFNLCLRGAGTAALMIPCPQEALVEVVLNDDVIRLDGSFAIAWSSTLTFSVEKAGQSIPSTILSGEGFVNTYRGSGKILLAPMLQLRPSERSNEKAES